MADDDERKKKKKEGSKRRVKTELTTFDKALGVIGFKSELQKRLEKAQSAKNKILDRQKRLEEIDIDPQTWNFVFGDETPKSYKDVHQITNVTPRNIWMEDDFIIKQIKKFKAGETFHPIQMYTLKWQPPNSPFRLMIPLHDMQLMENVIIRMANLGEEARSKVLFYFSPTEPSIPLFAPHISPYALMSYKTKQAVLNKLCEQYIDSKISLEDFTQTLLGDYQVWKRTSFNLMPADEQPYHRYLLDKPPPKINLKKMAKKYHNDEITLAEYVDYKFPLRKKQRDVESLEYPGPYTMTDCVICHRQDCATIKCTNCPSMVCKECIQSSFLDPVSKVGSFLHMHRLFCMKRGIALNRLVDPLPEVGVLVDLKATGRLQTYAALETEALERERRLFEDSTVEEDDGYDSEEERRRRYIDSEMAKAAAVHPEMVEITVALPKLNKKYRRIKRDLLETQLSLDKKGRGAKYFERLHRWKNSDVEALVGRVQSPLQFYQLRMSMLPPGAQTKAPETYDGLAKEMDSLLQNIAMLLRMESAQEYFDGVRAMGEKEEELLRVRQAQAKSAELLKYSSL